MNYGWHKEGNNLSRWVVLVPTVFGVCKLSNVDEFVPSLQDEVMEVEHLLAEPRNDHVSVDGILYLNEENKGKCYDTENLSSGFEFGLKSSCLDSHTTLNGNDDLELEVLDGLLDDVEIDDLERTDGFSSACGEYFLDFEFANKDEVLGSGPCEGSLLQNSSSESHSSGLSSESTKAPIAQSECKNDSLDETVSYKSHGAFRNSPRQPSNVDCMYNISLDIQHLHGLNNNRRLAGGILSYEKENISVEKCQPDAPREKRFRKPTQRYIEEFSNLKSKEKVPTTRTKNKHLSVSSCNELHIRIKALKKIPGEKSSKGSSNVTHSELQVRKGRPKQEKLEYDNEPFPLESKGEYVTPKSSRRKDRRKHQRMWTLSEVMKLVDGISEYGVGRWTDIKRFLFSSSSYRTPIDLRDKWRNLLRASSAQKFNKKEAEQNDELALRPLPSNVVRRVCELAKIHPYPRQRGSKKSCVSPVGSSSVIASQNKGSPVSLSRRDVRRKKST
ncbi:SANT/Myb domain [Sesbania bispinosa]|nr:SANT/Myb domain [Sesbania bispinosa]